MTQSPVESVDRALLILQALAGSGANGLTLADIASRLDLNKTTVHRALGALRFRVFVSQDPVSGKYLLGPAATALAEVFLDDENLPGLVHPALVALSSATDELVHLGTLSGTHIVYLDKVEPERAVRVWSAVGRRNPAVRTALGRAILAFRNTDRASLKGYIETGEGKSSGGVDAGHVWATLESARARGYATESQENEPDISCVATPLLRDGVAIAAVSITAPAERMSPDRAASLFRIMADVLPPLLPPELVIPATTGSRESF